MNNESEKGEGEGRQKVRMELELDERGCTSSKGIVSQLQVTVTGGLTAA